MPVSAPIAPSIQGEYGTRPNIHNLDDAAKAFEGMLLKQMMKAMNKSICKGGLLGDGFESGMYQEMFSNSIAEKSAGQFGLADALKESLGFGEKAQGTVQAISSMIRGMESYW